MFGLLGKTIAKIRVTDTPGITLTADAGKRVVSLNVNRQAGEAVVVWSGNYSRTPVEYLNSGGEAVGLYFSDLTEQPGYRLTELHANNVPDPEVMSIGQLPVFFGAVINYALIFDDPGLKSFDFFVHNPAGVAGVGLGAGHRDAFRGGDAANTEYRQPVAGLEQLLRVDLLESEVFQKPIYHTAIGALPPNLKSLKMRNKPALEVFPALPASLEYLVVFGNLNSVSGASIAAHMEACRRLKSLTLGLYQGGTRIGIGADWSEVDQIDLSGHHRLTRLMMNTVNADLLLPPNVFEAVNIANNPGLIDTAGILRGLLAPGNSQLVIWHVVNCPNFGAGQTWTLASVDLADTQLRLFGIHGAMGGRIDFSQPLPLTQLNISTRMEAINLTGLSALKYLYLNDCPDLTALDITALTGLEHFLALGSDRLLDGSSDLQSTLEAQSELTYLRSSCAFADLDLSGTKVNNRHSQLRNMTGTLTLPTTKHGSGMTSLWFLYLNPGLTAVVNLAVHDQIAQINAAGCSLLNLDLTELSNGIYFELSNTAITEADFSGRATTDPMRIALRDNLNLETIRFSEDAAYGLISSAYRNYLRFENCPQLAAVVNAGNISFTQNGLNRLLAFNCPLLDMAWPLGQMDKVGIPPNDIRIENNNMSTANVEATIATIAENESKWNYYTTNGHIKSLNIGGTNARPSGTYQAPPGNDPAGAAAMEQVYWLVNEKGWTITTS